LREYLVVATAVYAARVQSLKLTSASCMTDPLVWMISQFRARLHIANTNWCFNYTPISHFMCV